MFGWQIIRKFVLFILVGSDSWSILYIFKTKLRPKLDRFHWTLLLFSTSTIRSTLSLRYQIKSDFSHLSSTCTIRFFSFPLIFLMCYYFIEYHILRRTTLAGHQCVYRIQHIDTRSRIYFNCAAIIFLFLHLWAYQFQQYPSVTFVAISYCLHLN